MILLSRCLLCLSHSESLSLSKGLVLFARARNVAIDVADISDPLKVSGKGKGVHVGNNVRYLR